MPQTSQALREFNPWWSGSFDLDYKNREVYAELRHYLARRQVLALTGLRRVGKTTLMLKLAQDAMLGGLDPKRVLYFSFDESTTLDIRGLLRAYEEATKEDPTRGKMLLLLDEVQKLENWENKLKVQYDRLPNLKAVISGSASLFIRRGSTESLAGRLFEFKVEPLTFREYLGFAGVPFEPVGIHERHLEKALAAYTISQGFPELVGEDDRGAVARYIRESVVDRVVYRDLPQLVGVKEVSTLESVLNILMEEPGQLIDYSKLASDLAVDRHRVSTALDYLVRAYLVRKLYNFSGSRRKVERKLRKWYPAAVSPSLTFQEDDLSRSRVLEWLVVRELRCEYFWRDAYQKEVDVVCPSKPPLPIEVKSGKVELRGIASFMRKHKAPKGWVVSRDREEVHEVEGGRVQVVPAYKFLLDPPRLPAPGLTNP